MSGASKAECEKEAAWFVQEFLEWRDDFFVRHAKAYPNVPDEFVDEFQALRKACWYYFDYLLEYRPVRTG